MTDREKVIKALAFCVFPVSKGFPYQSHIADKGCEVVECPYRDDCDQMLLDALELLKEQEPITPTVNEFGKAYCGNCGENVGIFGKTLNVCVRMRYCPECGKAVKWDE